MFTTNYIKFFENKTQLKTLNYSYVQKKYQKILKQSKSFSLHYERLLFLQEPLTELCQSNNKNRKNDIKQFKNVINENLKII